MSGGREVEVIAVAEAWDGAMVTNDAHAIGAFMADEWTIVGPDGGVSDKEEFLEALRSRELSHSVMETHEPVVRIYGDTAVMVSRGLSAGRYRGTAFRFVERVTCVFVKRDGHWRCVHTHLSEIARP
jgi:ketosteroid isomerase-like protein